MSTPPNVITLLLFFVGVALCLWRIPQADRKHVILCFVAGVLWATLPLFDPSMRLAGYGFVVASFLVISLSQPRRRRRAELLANPQSLIPNP
jgi:membrane protein implicated in regulation of membrane protease activity